MIIHQGRLVADGDPRELEHGAVNESRLHLKIANGKGNQVLESLKKLPGVTQVETTQDESAEIKGYLVRSPRENDLRAEIFRLSGKSGWVLYEMHREVVSLEAVFRHLTSS